MKTKSIICAILLPLFMVACDKEDAKKDKESFYTDEILQENGIEGVEKCFDKGLTNDSTQACYAGIKEGKEWIALFDAKTNQLIGEWEGRSLPADKYGGVDNIMRSDFMPMGGNGYSAWIRPIGLDTEYKVPIQLVYLENGVIRYGKILEGMKYGIQGFANGKKVDHINGKGWLAIVYETDEPGSKSEDMILDPDGEVIVRNYKVSENLDDHNSPYLLSGFQNGRPWIGICGPDNTLLREAVCKEAFDRNQTFRTLDGETTAMHVRDIYFPQAVETEKGLLLIPTYNDDYSSVAADLYFFSNGNELHRIPLSRRGYVEDCLPWKDGSIVFAKHYVLSPEGQVLHEGDFDVSTDPDSMNEPISYTEWIEIREIFIKRVNADGQEAWYGNVKRVETYPEGSKFAYHVTRKDGIVWTIECNVACKDGSQGQFSFRLNIEDGAITYL